MKLKHLMLSLVAALVLFATTDASAGSKSHKQKCIKWDPLIGCYTAVLAAQDYSSFVFNAGGTWVGQLTTDIGQPISELFPCGSYATVVTGTWKRIGCRTYKCFATDVLVIKDGQEEAPQCCCPATPFGRVKAEFTLALSKDGRFFSSDDFLFSLWNVNDLTVNTDNILPPVPVGPFIGQRVGD